MGSVAAHESSKKGMTNSKKKRLKHEMQSDEMTKWYNGSYVHVKRNPSKQEIANRRKQTSKQFRGGTNKCNY